jgi:hypothetical protein
MSSGEYLFQQSWLSSWITEASDGFSVWLGRGFAVYKEGARRLTLSTDAGGDSVTIFLGSGARWDDDPNTRIDDGTQMIIVERVKKALEWKGYEVSLFGQL